MTQNYSQGGSVPAPLPFRIRLSDGRTRTNPSSFTAEEIADAGFVSVDPKPEPGPDQVVTWGGFAWVVRDKTPEELAAEQEALRAQLVSDLADHRYGFETGGVTLPNGLSVRTDRGTRASITEAVNALEAGLMVAPIPWKLATGWVDLTHADLKGIASAVAAHVQAGFAAERSVQAQIEGAADLPAFDVPAAFAAALSA